jgi:ribosomal 50S subunit-recycling heat shock protein
MRIDKFLKTSALIKRRTVASEFCKRNKVQVNNIDVKPSYQIKNGDIISLAFNSGEVRVEIIDVSNEKHIVYKKLD